MKKTAVVLLAALLLPGLGLLGFRLYQSAAKPGGIPAASDTDREIYLFTQGFKGELTDAREITVPPPDDAVFADYAALQKAQGLPVTDYTGQCAERYVYRLSASDLYAELLCADGILIGAMCFDPVTHRMYRADGTPFSAS